MGSKGEKRVAVIPGDGIGKEVMAQALRVIERISARYGHCIRTEEALAGGSALDATGVPLPESTLDLCKRSHAVLLGAVGGPQWDDNPPELKPEKGILGLRAGLGLFANLRPAHVYPTLAGASSLKPEIVKGVDLLIVRELTGGIYFGQPRGISKSNGQEVGINTLIYRTSEIERIARVAFEAAGKRRGRLTSVDKANVLESSQLWRRVVAEVGRSFPDISLNHMLVDNCAMQLIADPGQFDVIVTTNMFGDILSDEASMLTGSIGMLPSASLGGRNGLYEPVHGTAPDIAGRDLANPIAMIASTAMMFKYSFGLQREAAAIERAIASVLDEGIPNRRPDGCGRPLGGHARDGAVDPGPTGRTSHRRLDSSHPDPSGKAILSLLRRRHGMKPTRERAPACRAAALPMRQSRHAWWSFVILGVPSWIALFPRLGNLGRRRGIIGRFWWFLPVRRRACASDSQKWYPARVEPPSSPQRRSFKC